MSNIDKCIGCEHYESVYDGYGLCMRDAIGVMVVADYEPTKNYAHCEINKNSKAQKETKTAYQMQHEGWCDDCNQDIAECIKQGQCEGYRRSNEKTN